MSDEYVIIDKAAMAELLDTVGGDDNFLQELIEEFLTDMPRQLASIEEALTLEDAETVRRAAHSLKSNSASFGANHLRALSFQMEERGKAGNLAGADALLAEIKQASQQVITALRAYDARA